MMIQLPTGDWVDASTVVKVYRFSNDGCCIRVECKDPDDDVVYNYRGDKCARDAMSDKIGAMIVGAQSELRARKEAYALELARARGIGAEKST